MRPAQLRTPLSPWLLAVLLMFSLLPLRSVADDTTTLAALLAEKEEPAGVVFEIVTGREGALQWALPRVQDDIKQLRSRYPELHIAVVTHGREQFDLQKSKQQSQKKVHTLSQQLVADGVALHVCGTHAQWRGLEAEDFPDYVDVAAAGPAQINDYRALGYKVIVIKRQ